MKRVTVFIVISVILFSCNEQTMNNKDSEINSSKEIAIKVCGETSPVWLMNEISSITQPVEPNYRPVSVYSTILNGITYVLVTDMVNDAAAYILRFFLCSGESIPFGTEEYNVLQRRYNENREEFTLLWSNSKI
ncbi:MAG: hypothetical protein FWF54_04885 [Candidatus Azobacteroides sp.]|nr:hypothetical protein [Candidatus Azobacteroides sp.]